MSKIEIDGCARFQMFKRTCTIWLCKSGLLLQKHPPERHGYLPGSPSMTWEKEWPSWDEYFARCESQSRQTSNSLNDLVVLLTDLQPEALTTAFAWPYTFKTTSHAHQPAIYSSWACIMIYNLLARLAEEVRPWALRWKDVQKKSVTASAMK